jgi:hypothetical protein
MTDYPETDQIIKVLQRLLKTPIVALRLSPD